MSLMSLCIAAHSSAFIIDHQFGRDMIYDNMHTTVWVGASGEQVYRVSLEHGQFVTGMELPAGSQACTSMSISPLHHLIAIGTEAATIACFDPRVKKAVACLSLPEGAGWTSAVALHGQEATQMAVGTGDGHVLLYDIRSSRPLHARHLGNDLPVTSVCFHA